VLTALAKPTIFAHRGSSSYAPENTLAAFTLAIRQEADAIELDVKLTLDRIPVVIHDQTVDRTTEGTGQVRQLTLGELKQMEAGTHFDVAFRGEKIPSLEEVFETIGGKIFINIELTNYASLTDTLPDLVSSLVQKYNLTRSVMFSSFNPLALLRVRKLLPQVPRGLLAFPGAAGGWARSGLRRMVPCEALHPEYNDITPAFVKRIHRSSQRIHAYTVNHPEDMRRLFEMGVDGIFTDDPLLARQVLIEVK